MEEEEEAPSPTQHQLTLQSRLDNATKDAWSIIKPNQVTRRGLTSENAAKILGFFLSLIAKQREWYLALSQAELREVLTELVREGRRNDERMKARSSHHHPKHMLHRPQDPPLNTRLQSQSQRIKFHVQWNGWLSDK